MLLRAFGPLPDVQEGVRYLIKYRDCAFTDVPEEGRAAVENLTNAGLYIPENNEIFGPDESMMQADLAVLIDRIHAYLQSSPKDDFYSWVTADILNDPDFLWGDYDIANFIGNVYDSTTIQNWALNMLFDFLENPDTPEKANIAAYFSTYIDQDARQNSMQILKPMADAIWNASDFNELLDVLADISRETGLEMLLTDRRWHAMMYFESEQGKQIECFMFNPMVEGDEGCNDYQLNMDHNSKLLMLIGYGKKESEAAVRNMLLNYRYQRIREYDASSIPREYAIINAHNIPQELSFLPLAEYLERAGYGDKEVCLSDLADSAITLDLLSRPENLPAAKAKSILKLLDNLNSVVPLYILDVINDYGADVYTANPDMILGPDIWGGVMDQVQTDVFYYFSKTEEYRVLYEQIHALCTDITQYYRRMFETNGWISDATRLAALEKIDKLQVELIIPSDLSSQLHVEYKSAADGGTLYENFTHYLKARRQWLTDYHPDKDYIWVYSNVWDSPALFSRSANTYYLFLNGLIASHASKDPSYEALLAYIGIPSAHEISHSFDKGGLQYDIDGNYGNWCSEEDMEELLRRCEKLADFMSGYEYFPGYSYKDGNQVVNEAVADLTAMKCIMNIARMTPDFDYLHFFECFASQYAVSATRTGLDFYLSTTEHAQGRCRVNRILSLR